MLRLNQKPLSLCAGESGDTLLQSIVEGVNYCRAGGLKVIILCSDAGFGPLCTQASAEQTKVELEKGIDEILTMLSAAEELSCGTELNRSQRCLKVVLSPK